MKKCKVDPKHHVDTYGCIDCFTIGANAQMFKRMDKEDKTYKNRNPLS